jgi:hypothetical protein
MTEVRIKRRCAIYTRKSSEEGLEQEFNSLHAQREACEAYIASQRSGSSIRCGTSSSPPSRPASCSCWLNASTSALAGWTSGCVSMS